MNHSRIRRLIVYAMWGAVLFVTTSVMKVLPNIHLLALFITVLTRVYRFGALIPIYIYVFLEGAIQGFHAWWWPYLYIWAVLWAAVMLLPKKLPDKAASVCFCVLGFLHGALFGTMWAPYHALLYGLTLEKAMLWVATGLPYDAVHGVSNAIACTLAIPLIRLVERLEKRI